jgi:hypothetical protein
VNTKWLLSLIILAGGTVYVAHAQDDSDEAQSMDMMQDKPMMMQDKSMAAMHNRMMGDQPMMMGSADMPMAMETEESSTSEVGPVEEAEAMEVDELAVGTSDRSREEWGPWPLDVPVRAVVPPYCGSCELQDDGTYKRSWGIWPLDVPLRVLPTKYCDSCDND